MILRRGLLDGVGLVLAAAGEPGPLAAAAAEQCHALGASVDSLEVDPFGDEPHAVGANALVWDGAGAFAAYDGVQAVRAALDGAWLAIRAAIDVKQGGQKIVLIAPPAGDAHAEAARAGLENLARTLGTEWARFGIRVNTLLPGTASDVATLVAYVVSPAGDYFTGSVLSAR